MKSPEKLKIHITEAIRLYRLGKVKKLLITVEGAINYKKGISYADKFIRYMEDMGVDTKDIILEKEARTTSENIENIKGLIPSSSNDVSFLLITSGHHMRRVLKGFENSGLNITPYGVDVPSVHPKLIWRDFMPSWKAAMSWQKIFHEMIGLAVI